MTRNRNGWVGLAVVVVSMLLAGGGAWAATWDGNGDADNDGSWSGTTNWDPDGDPNGQVIVLPTVDGNGSSGDATRTITIDSAATYGTSFTINQSTGGFINRLLFSANLTTASGVGTHPVNINLSAGAVVLDKGSFNLVFGRSTTLTLPAGTTLNSTGGAVKQNWNGGSGNISNSGIINLTAGTTQFIHENRNSGDQLVNYGTINLSGGALNVPHANTLINNGTIAGNGSSTITARNVQLMAGSSISNVATLDGVATFDLQATDHTAISLSNTTVSTYNSGSGGIRTIEVGTETAGRFQIDQLTVNSGYGDHRTTLVDNHNNDLSSAAAEHLEVNTLRWDGSNNGELDLNGLDVKVNTAVEFDPFQRVLSNRKSGSTSTITLGNSQDLGSIMNGDFNTSLSLLVQNGATLDIQQSVPVSYLNVEAGSGRINVNSAAASATGAGGIRPNTVLGHTWSATDELTVDFDGGTYTLSAAISVDSGASLTIAGNLTNRASNNTTSGLIASGSGTRIAVSGDYSSGGLGGRLQIDSGATVKMGGDFLPGNWWNGQYGDVNKFWEVDTTASPGAFTFNGGGASTQDFEVLSRDYAVSGGALERLYSATVSRLPFGTLNVGEAGSPADVRLVNNVKNNSATGSTETTQVARNLIVTTNSTLDLASYTMVVALGTSSTVAGSITNSVAGGTLTLADSADLAFQTGGVIDVDTMSIGAGSIVDFNGAQNAYIQVNGDQTVTFDALIAGGQIINSSGGPPVAEYDSGTGHTLVNVINTLQWVGGASTVWDSSALNWEVTGTSPVGSGTALAYADGAEVTFPAGASQNSISVSSAVNPSDIVFTGADNYTFTGSAITGAEMTKSGTGSVSFAQQLTLNSLIWNDGDISVASGIDGLTDVIVPDGATFRGKGTVNANLSVLSGGTLAPGE